MDNKIKGLQTFTDWFFEQLENQAEIKRKESPYAVFCPDHGQVFLTQKEYEDQMSKPDALWKCPICGLVSQWDDDNYEKYTED